jgi:precorrin-6A/cobalt-precorrin-6A reductase
MPLKVLILGGSSEASALAAAIARDSRFDALLSLAGRTQAPAVSPLPRRSGGFGGAQGLADYLSAEKVDALVVAVHPFAAQMRRNAVAAVQLSKTPLLIVDRPPWTPVPGDRWSYVPDMAAAASALGETPRRVLLTVGRQDLAPFAAQTQHAYLVRSIDPPAEAPAAAELILDRGPFTESGERRLMVERGVEVLVTKNAGGEATAAKLAAARALGLEVFIVDRPPLPDLGGLNGHVVADADQALNWLYHQARSPTQRGVYSQGRP